MHVLQAVLVAAPRVVRLVAVNYAFQMPPHVMGGDVTVRLVNRGTEPHYAAFYRLGERRSVRDFLAWRASRTPPPSWLASLAGPAPVMPGDSTDLRMTLAAGRYVVMCGYPGASGRQHADDGMVRELMVGAARESRTPNGPNGPRARTGDARLVLGDSTFSLVARLRAGRRTLVVENHGAAARQALLVRLPEGVTLDDEKRWFDTGFRGARDGLPSGGALVVAAGGRAVVTRDFASGRWAVLSHLRGAWETLEFRVE